MSLYCMRCINQTKIHVPNIALTNANIALPHIVASGASISARRIPNCADEIVYLTVPLVILAFIFANHFNIVGMGKDFSKNLGVPYNFVLFAGLTIAAMITASIIVVVGSISYIGLIVPNVVAMFKGDKIRGTLVDTALFGALFVLVCDIIGRVVIMPYELPIELIVGILGSLIFVALLIYRLKHGRKIVSIKLFNEQKEVNNEQEKKYI